MGEGEAGVGMLGSAAATSLAAGFGASLPPAGFIPTAVPTVAVAAIAPIASHCFRLRDLRCTGSIAEPSGFSIATGGGVSPANVLTNWLSS